MGENSKHGLQSNTILFFWSACLFFLLVCFSYYRYVLLRDYTLYAQVSCDPSSEQCFIYECSSTEDEACDESEPYSYFKIVYMPATNAPTCNAHEEPGCEELICDSTSYCEEITCSDDTMADYQEGEMCG